MTFNNYSVPVIMFHSVGSEKTQWHYTFLSESVDTFEKKITHLKRNGYEFIFHDDLFHYMRDGKALPEKSVMLTFDDGYLDNWAVVFPILKRLGVKFTIYVCHEFVDTRPLPRPTLDDVRHGIASSDSFELIGYLSWAELSEMQKSGLVDIQSHTSTHTWHFSGADPIDFITPETIDRYPWMMWNLSPSLKSIPLVNEAWAPIKKSVMGLPVFENKRAMIAGRFLENPELREEIKWCVEDNGGVEFFKRQDCRTLLKDVVSGFGRSGRTGRFETPEERNERLRYELQINKLVLEQRLNKDVRYLCWPGGAYNESLLRLAEGYGYWATTVKEGFNRYGDDPSMVHRISSGNHLGESKFPWKYRIFTLRFYMARFQKRIWATALDRIYRRR